MRHKGKMGTFGQAPGDYPEIVQFLIDRDIDSMSLHKDPVIKTLAKVARGKVKPGKSRLR
jgi:phosphoenolpyruvate synthase/pyruvate phosphate dikinase